MEGKANTSSQASASQRECAQPINFERFSRLHRLAPATYQGRVVIHWTMATDKRATGWLSDLAHSKMREALLHVAARYHIWCVAYCLMPDHAHFVWISANERADHVKGASLFRRLSNGSVPGLMWQRQAYDHVLKGQESSKDGIASVCHYVFENPLRAKLVARREDYPYWGSCLLRYPDVDPRRSDFWDVFWTLFLREESMSARQDAQLRVSETQRFAHQDARGGAHACPQRRTGIPRPVKKSFTCGTVNVPK